MLSTVVERGEERTTIRLDGELDSETATVFRDCVADVLLTAPAGVDVDLSKVEFVDSVGVGALVGAMKAAGVCDAPMRLVTPAEPVRRLLEITGLARVFTIVG